MAEKTRAAFFRVEGSLVKRVPLSAPAFLTVNSQAMKARVSRLGSVALAAGMKLLGGYADTKAAQRLSWAALRGMSSDRLAVLGLEYYERYILPNIREVARDLISEARRQGHRIILVTELLDVIAAPLVAELGADEIICNVMEFRKDAATGRLREPIIGGRLSGQWAREFAADSHIDLAQSSGYGASADDGLLLSAVGKPCAVFPDMRLRRMARELDWPVVEA